MTPSYIEQQVLIRVCSLIVTRARVVYLPIYDSRADAMRKLVDTPTEGLSIQESRYYLQGGQIIADANLIMLVEAVGLEVLFSVDPKQWIPYIDAWVIIHAKSCRLMWDYLYDRAESNC